MTSPVVINDIIPRTQSTATNLQQEFDTDWTADATTDILVYARASGVAADDQTQLVSTMDYNVSFIGTLQTVRVTFLTGRTTGDIITISRDTPADRTNLYTNTNFTTSMLNEDFGILTLVDQQAQMYDTVLAPHYNISASFTAPPDYAIDEILPILGPNQFWVKNPGNTAIIAATLPGGGSHLPNAGPFVTYTADADLTGAQNLGLLSSGFMFNTVIGAVSTITDIGSTGTGVVVLQNGATINQPIINRIYIGPAEAGGIYDSVTSTQLMNFVGVADGGNIIQVKNGAGTDAPVIVAVSTIPNLALQLEGRGNLGVIIDGTGTDDDAAAGFVGEILTSTVAAPGTSMTSTASITLTSLNLTAGDWDVYGNVYFTIGGSCTTIIASISDTNNTLDAAPNRAGSSSVGTLATQGVVAPYRRISVGSTTPVYLVADAVFSTSTVQMSGTLTARRAR